MVGVNAGRAGRVPLRMTVLYNSINQGYGGNQKIGYHYAIENGFDYVALLHGDGQYAPEVLPDLMKVFDDPSVDAVFGSRMLKRLMVMARLLVRLRPRLFGFQCLVVTRPRPTLQTLLDQTRSLAREKAAAAA